MTGGGPAGSVPALAGRSGRVGARFDLDHIDAAGAALARAWLVVALAALAGAGLFAIVLVAARTPWVQALLPGTRLFRATLVAHVDLSVLVWFVASCGMLWALWGPARARIAGALAAGCAGLGALVMAIAPFEAPFALPVMSNYVPVLDAPAFLAGLALVAAALGIAAAGMLSGMRRPIRLDGAASLRLGLGAAAAAALLTLAALAASLAGIDRTLDPKSYYELVFWGPGHVAQFTWTLMLLVAWLWLGELAGAPAPLSAGVAATLFGVTLAGACVGPFIYAIWPAASAENRGAFTALMRVAGGLSVAPVALAAVVGLRFAAPAIGTERPLRAALAASIVLFLAGGAIGFLVRGSDVRVPAHYHGSIVGITIALMGLGYALAPRLGGRVPAVRAACWQIRLYALGQLAHMIGLVWSGGYGVSRKVAGAEQVLGSAGERFGMGLMGAGGALAIAAGAAYVVIMVHALRRPAVSRTAP